MLTITEYLFLLITQIIFSQTFVNSMHMYAYVYWSTHKAHHRSLNIIVHKEYLNKKCMCVCVYLCTYVYSGARDIWELYFSAKLCYESKTVLKNKILKIMCYFSTLSTGIHSKFTKVQWCQLDLCQSHI